MWISILLASLFICAILLGLYLIYGLKVCVRLDTDNLSICIKALIFDKIEVFCFKFFVCDGEFYQQINKKDIKKSVLSKSDRKNLEVASKKFYRIQHFNYLISTLPKIQLRQLHINYAVRFDDFKDGAMFDGALKVISYTALGISDKLVIKDFELNNITSEGNFKGVLLSLKFGFSIFTLMNYVLRMRMSKRKFTVEA